MVDQGTAMLVVAFGRLAEAFLLAVLLLIAVFALLDNIRLALKFVLSLVVLLLRVVIILLTWIGKYVVHGVLVTLYKELRRPFFFARDPRIASRLDWEARHSRRQQS